MQNKAFNKCPYLPIIKTHPNGHRISISWYRQPHEHTKVILGDKTSKVIQFNQQLANFFYKGYILGLWAYDLCHSCSTLLRQHENRHRQYINEWRAAAAFQQNFIHHLKFFKNSSLVGHIKTSGRLDLAQGGVCQPLYSTRSKSLVSSIANSINYCPGCPNEYHKKEK